MQVDFSTFKPDQLAKAGELLKASYDLGLNLSCDGVLDVNQSSGDIFLYLEDYKFVLYIGPSRPAERSSIIVYVEVQESEGLAIEAVEYLTELGNFDAVQTWADEQITKLQKQAKNQ